MPEALAKGVVDGVVMTYEIVPALKLDTNRQLTGTVRDGGSFIERVTNISCWNTLMDESAYMNKRWNDFKLLQ